MRCQVHIYKNNYCMKIIFFLTVTLVIISKTSYCQDVNSYEKKPYELSAGDTYVAKIDVKEKLNIDQCACQFGDGKYCVLYRAEIISIYLVPDKKVFDSTSLSKMRYFLADPSLSLDANNSYTVTLSPGTGTTYLRINRVLTVDDASKYQFIQRGVYLSGFINCYQVGFFNKILLSLRFIKPEKINYDSKKIRRDEFENYIRQHF